MSQRFSKSLTQGAILGVVAAAFAATSASAIENFMWDGNNAPKRLLLNPGEYDDRFDETGTRIPFSARVPVSRIPYADTYWPSNRGGIAYRWNSSPWVNPQLVEMAIHHPYYLPTPSEQSRMDEGTLEVLRELEKLTTDQRAAFIRSAQGVTRYRSPTLAQLKTMTREQLARLSPTEKYDIVRGRKAQDGEIFYELTLEGKKANGSGRAYWEGICHGWAPASINHGEPLPVDVPVTLSNGQSVTIPFGSADVKAIINYLYAGIDRVNRMGTPCGDKLSEGGRNRNWGSGSCSGVNAGAFHLALTNYIALRHQPFVADMSHGNEIWNNAIYAYDMKIAERRNGPVGNAAGGTKRSVRVQVTVKVPSDDERFGPQWEATVGKEEVQVPEIKTPITPELKAKLEHGYRYDVGKYEYWLDLGEGDRILGGSWVSFERPDYLWVMPKYGFTGKFEALNRIYRSNQR